MTVSSPATSGKPAGRARVRVAVVAAEEEQREAWCAALAAAADVDVVAWADALDSLLVLGTRASTGRSGRDFRLPGVARESGWP